jgi:uncharacterized phage infection (PIP) family protein YhgE
LHFLTKFLVVVAAVLGVLLAGLSVAATANFDAVAGELDEARSNADALETQVGSIQDRMSLQRERLEARIAEARQSAADAEAEAERLRASLNEAQRRLNEAQAARERFNSQIEGFQALIATLEETDQARASEIRRLRENEIESARREIALADQINELSGQLEVVREAQRALLEENTELRERLEGGGGTGDGVARGVKRAPADLNALVTSVEDDPRGDQLIGVDAGSRDGLEERMGLVVTREGRFVATLVIERVGLNEAVASVEVVREGESVQRGDRVIADRR